MSKKKVSFPSASKLVITFDKRCSLGPNAALLIEYVSNGVVIVETVKGIFGDDSKYSNGLVIPCSEFEVLTHLLTYSLTHSLTYSLTGLIHCQRRRRPLGWRH